MFSSEEENSITLINASQQNQRGMKKKVSKIRNSKMTFHCETLFHWHYRKLSSNSQFYILNPVNLIVMSHRTKNKELNLPQQ